VDNKTGFKPPYNAFRTFWGFVDTLSKKPLPPQIDRSMLEGKSGTDQMGLNFALQGFGLIASDEDRRTRKYSPSPEKLPPATRRGALRDRSGHMVRLRPPG
jgi:hypothetical protein